MTDLSGMSELDLSRPTPTVLLRAYAAGIFPMADPDRGSIDWYCPEWRGVIPLDAFHVPKNVARAVRQGKFMIRSDNAFEAVMRACAEPRAEDADDDASGGGGASGGTWIDERLISAYVGLFAEGNAHSVEAWLDDQLVGGLYGVHLGAAFFGESMFSRPDLGGTNASKICLVHLVEHLRKQGFTLLDTQFWNPHLDQFGCVEIPQRVYLHHLRDAVAKDVVWGTWETS